MSLHVLDMEQRSDEWYAARLGMVTASAVGQLVTAKTFKPASNDHSRALTAALVAERVTGWTDPTHVSDDMWRGIEHEPIARDTYSEHHAPAIECGFMVRDDWGWSLGYSPDGLVGDDGLIEIKCPRAKGHLQTVVSGQVPASYMPQLQAGLLVSGRAWVDYVSFVAGMPLWVKRVTPDLRWFNAITEAVAAFEVAAERMAADYYAAVEGLPTTEPINNDIGLVF